MSSRPFPLKIHPIFKKLLDHLREIAWKANKAPIPMSESSIFSSSSPLPLPPPPPPPPLIPIQSFFGIRAMWECTQSCDPHFSVFVKNETSDSCTYWFLIRSRAKIENLFHVNVFSGFDLKRRFQEEFWDPLTYKAIVVFFLNFGHYVGPTSAKFIPVYFPNLKFFSRSVVSSYHPQQFQNSNDRNELLHQPQFGTMSQLWSQLNKFFQRWNPFKSVLSPVKRDTLFSHSFDSESLSLTSSSSSSSSSLPSQQPSSLSPLEKEETNKSPPFPKESEKQTESEIQVGGREFHDDDFILFGLAFGNDDSRRLDSFVVSCVESRKQIIFQTIDCFLSDFDLTRSSSISIPRRFRTCCDDGDVTTSK